MLKISNSKECSKEALRRDMTNNKTNKMVDLGLTVSVITVNVKCLKTLIKS